ncbi:hypothetical protein [Streptomyces sp. 142MFCol3.1]|uniref:hypothetical protein n=1 Tax=Streptomyces sp. 142MFCol3.1 TaxID=1172179 RepID=UPI00041A97ED|nr:hypothetical protein [Streptomyces sp. 142MFCol3.1]
MTDIPDGLISLECAAEAERAKLAGLTGEAYDTQWHVWRSAADAVQAAVSAHAEAAQVDPQEVERAVKAAVRRAQEDPAVE